MPLPASASPDEMRAYYASVAFRNGPRLSQADALAQLDARIESEGRTIIAQQIKAVARRYVPRAGGDRIGQLLSAIRVECAIYAKGKRGVVANDLTTSAALIDLRGALLAERLARRRNRATAVNGFFQLAREAA